MAYRSARGRWTLDRFQRATRRNGNVGASIGGATTRATLGRRGGVGATAAMRGAGRGTSGVRGIAGGGGIVTRGVAKPRAVGIFIDVGGGGYEYDATAADGV